MASVEKSLDELENNINIDFVKKHGDDVRKRILDETEVDLNKTSPNVFNYRMPCNSIGLNEISNVDMGYACSSADLTGYVLSKRNPYLKELEYNVQLMKESENAIVVLNGGLFSYLPKNGKTKLLSYQDQVAYFYSLFKDLADQGKIVAMVRGTEEHRILKNQKIDVLGILQDALGLNKKVCNDALINVEIPNDFIDDANVGIRTINWNNSATTSAYVGRKMERRALDRGGADIYLARTTMNYFKTAIMGENKNSQIIKKPIYLISGGSYTPFKGAATAGAEYNSIKDSELPPNSFWYKVTVEENPKAENFERPYIVRVNPIQYVAHQELSRGTDKVVAGIENLIEEAVDKVPQKFIDEFVDEAKAIREDGRAEIRKILLKNREIADTNKSIKEYRDFLKGKVNKEEKQEKIVDLGSNVPDLEENIVFDM